MKQILTFLILGILFFSCSTNEEEIENNQDNAPLITQMSPYSLTSENQSGLYTYFEYDNAKRLTKKTGGLVQLGTISFYSNEMYTSLVYDNNRVTIENFSISTQFTVPKNYIYITLNNSKQIVEKDIPVDNNHVRDKKQFYKYSNNKLVEIETTFPNYSYDPTYPGDYILSYLEKFYYDSNGNLAKTEYFELRNGINIGEKIIRTFENYDNSINPLKRFYLLNQYFYGSISKNNYRKYTLIHYDNDVMTSTAETICTYLYDTNGNILVE